ncbi:MAG: 2-hydroxyacyl-CoA dehydratase family protein [Gemmatimonadota bacterium]|nr:2-hydroxyacyl-CoA dehydratase family protein [Gemmatimonadota bacterium]
MSDTDLIGRGAREGKRLFTEWFDGLTEAAERDDPAAYVFVMGSLAEVLRSFDLDVVFPEINSLQTAVKKISGEYLGEAEDYGYSPDICGYVKADVALQLRGGEHPLGRVPRPTVAVLTNACNTYIKWAEIWERLHDTPVFTIDVPGSRSAPGVVSASRADFARDLDYVEHQIRELIYLLEEITGRRFDIDAFRDRLWHANAMSRAWHRVLEINRSSPAPYDAVTEGTIYLGVANAFRGTGEGARYFEDLVEELEERRRLGLTPSGDEEQHRLIFVGVPCYPIFRRFYELFSEWGGAFVSSTYLWFASGGLDEEFQYDLEDPVRSLAEGVLRGVRSATDSMLFHDRALLRAIDDYRADGVVFHPVKSCRTVSTGLADSRRAVLEERDVQCLYIESDMMDDRVVSEAQLKNRIDAFFEGLRSRELRLAAEESKAPAGAGAS